MHDIEDPVLRHSDRRVLAGKYRVDALLGRGWEGEVYRVTEARTGASRAAKLFFPHRNERDRVLTIYAKKLEKLRECPIVIKYHHSDTITVKRRPITILISEFVEGELLEDLVGRLPGKRMQVFVALHLVHSLAVGLEQVHAMREYHGDLHAGNVLVRRRGVSFVVKLVDLYHLGSASSANMREDVINLIRILYDIIGGAARYPAQCQEVKDICRGLRRDLIIRRFPTMHHLRRHLEQFEWGNVP